VNAFVEVVDSQTLSVAAKHDILVKATSTSKVGSESVMSAARSSSRSATRRRMKGFAEAAVLAASGTSPASARCCRRVRRGEGAQGGYDKGACRALQAAGQQAVSFAGEQIPAVTRSSPPPTRPAPAVVRQGAGEEGRADRGRGTGGPGGAGPARPPRRRAS